ncbi:MAG: ATP-grasp domain-containing protein [Candidatus Paceibacterota bacterium]|jgi:predicted ATP-grasp superfamily ATP-dependent carboligase
MKTATSNNNTEIIKKIFGELKEDYAFFGLGVNAFNRLGPEHFISNYQILSLRNPLENELIKRDINVFSLEKESNSHIDAPRNSNTVIKSKAINRFLKQFKNKKLVFLVYKPFLGMEKIAKKNGWILCANPYKFGKQLFENKIIFRKILESLNLPVPPGEIVENPKIILKNFENFQKKYDLPIVIQHPARGGGRGTFFIKNKREFEQILPLLEGETLVLKYISGSSPSITGCVTPWGIAHTSPQLQILDQEECYNLKTKEGNGLWCGHDWSCSNFKKETLESIYISVKKVGQYLSEKKYKGIFGLDFIQDRITGKVYVGECNPRLLGSFPTLTMVQILNNEVPILAFHILSFLKLKPEQDNVMRHIFMDSVNSMLAKKCGAQLVLHNKEGQWAKTTKKILPGVYKIQKDKLIYIREGYSMNHIKKNGEFLLSDGLRKSGAPLSPNRRIMRFITKESVLKDENKLSDWAKKAGRLSYESLDIKPVKFFKLKRFFNKKFMLKG